MVLIIQICRKVLLDKINIFLALLFISFSTNKSFSQNYDYYISNSLSEFKLSYLPYKITNCQVWGINEPNYVDVKYEIESQTTGVKFLVDPLDISFLYPDAVPTSS